MAVWAEWLTPARETLADRVAAPIGTRTWRVVAAVAGAVALTALMAQVVIHLPFTPVPVTGQTFAVLVTGAALGWRRGLLAQALYVLLGLVGLPVFAGGTGGLGQLVGASGGYLLGFVAAAAVLGWLAERGWDRGREVVAAMLLGEAALYLFGVGWLAVYLHSVEEAVLLGFVPFMVGDAVKLAASAALLPLAWRLAGPAARGHRPRNGR
jgi:biotin transport system substrate-specific component